MAWTRGERPIFRFSSICMDSREEHIAQLNNDAMMSGVVLRGCYFGQILTMFIYNLTARLMNRIRTVAKATLSVSGLLAK